ncbi:MAG TPA: hypothetical protein VHW09_32555 [Bryobacteraceae bacterium]|nr:hypothetical protein [Bryobacteraceae bacterium]
MKRMLLAVALMMTPLLAQSGPDPNEQIQKVVVLKYADPRAVENLLGIFGVQTRVDPQMKVITLSGHRANVTTAEEAIKQLDIPGAAQKDIDLTIFFLLGTDNSGPTGSPVPADLQSTVATLKSTFPFKSYGLLDVLSLRTRSGASASTSGQLSQGRLTTFSVRSAALENEGTMIQLSNLNAGLKIPIIDKEGKTTFMNTGLDTAVVDVKEGQKLVVGRSSLNGPDTALFLVLIAKVAQ